MDLALAFISCLLFLFALDVLKRGPISALLSPFWLFSLFVMLSYPVKFLIIDNGYPYLAPVKNPRETLNLALIVSFIFWALVLLSYSAAVSFDSKNKFRGRYPFSFSLPVYQSRLKKLSVLFILFLFSVSAYYYYGMFSATGFEFVNVYHGNEQNEARVGAGHHFLLGDLYLYAFIAFLSHADLNKNRLIVYIVLFLAVVLAVLHTTLLSARRPLFIIFYVILVYLVIYRNKKIVSLMLLAAFPYISVALAPIAQIFRSSAQKLISGKFESISFDQALVSIGSTFEGVEHLGTFLRKIDPVSIFLGVDQGIAYLFNSGLAFFPRAIWSSKPEVYGSVEIQDFLYNTGGGVMTLPPGIVTDAIYGFGFFGMVIYSILVGVFLFWIESCLKNSKNISPIALAVVLYSYIMMFNLVRSGTGLFQGVLLVFVIVLILNFLNRLSLVRPKSEGQYVTKRS